MKEKLLQIIADEVEIPFGTCVDVFDRVGSYDLTIVILHIHKATNVSIETLVLGRMY